MNDSVRPTRYKDVKPIVDSGYNTRKEDMKWGGKINSRFRREENFRRVSCKTLVKLLDEESGVDVLLLDLRDGDEFAQNHIHRAEHYPAPTLTRASNNLTPSILQYANKEPGQIIVIYDNDERIAQTTGAIFFEKGFDNVYVLSGGLTHFSMINSRLVFGDVQHLVDKALHSSGRSVSRRNSSSSSTSSDGQHRPDTNESCSSLMSSTSSFLSMHHSPKSMHSSTSYNNAKKKSSNRRRKMLADPVHFTSAKWKS